MEKQTARTAFFIAWIMAFCLVMVVSPAAWASQEQGKDAAPGTVVGAVNAADGSGVQGDTGATGTAGATGAGNTGTAGNTGATGASGEQAGNQPAASGASGAGASGASGAGEAAGEAGMQGSNPTASGNSGSAASPVSGTGSDATPTADGSGKGSPAAGDGTPASPAADGTGTNDASAGNVGSGNAAASDQAQPTKQQQAEAGQKATTTTAAASTAASTATQLATTQTQGASSAKAAASTSSKASATTQAAAKATTTTATKATTTTAKTTAKTAAKTTTVSTQATAKQLVANGVYWLESAGNLNLVLDISGESKANGGNAIVWDYTGGANQKWRISYDAKSGCYYLLNVNSGKALDVAGASSASGTNVLQWAKKASGTTNQLWRITYAAGSGYTFTSALRSNLVLSIQGNKAAKGNNVQVATGKKAAWQRWWLIPQAPAVKAANTLANGVYTIARADAAGQVLDVSGVSQTPGANVGVWQANGGGNQKWAIVRGAGNFYTVVSVSSGQSLDISGECRTAGANVLQWTQKSSDNQKWAIQKNADGTYSFISKMNGMALSTTGTKNGSNARTWLANGAAHEKFVLKATPLVTAGVYSISPRSNTSMMVDVSGASQKSGTGLLLWSYNGGLNQKYQITHLGNNVYTIQPGHAGCLLADSGGKAVQSTRNASATVQQWKAQWKSTGISFVNVKTGRALALAGGSTRSGTAVRTAAASAAGAQRFMVAPRDVLDAGMYTLRTYAGSRLLDVAGESKADGANVEIWQSTGGNNQKFQITGVGGGYYKIVCVKSDKAVDVSGASKANGANVLQWTYKGSANQLWKPQISPNGGIVFINKGSGKALTVAGNADKQGANVCSSANKNAAGQRWMPSPTTRKVEDVALERAMGIARGKGSATNWLITVDLSNHRTVVFQRGGSGWQVVKNWTCTTGAPSTPTVTGDYTVGSRGYSFGSGYTCYYWTQFYGDYLFHSVLYYEGTRSVLDGRLGQSLSHGCVRLNIDNAYWIYDNIPSGTKVTTYY